MQIKLKFGSARFWGVSRAVIRLDNAGVYDDTSGTIGGDDAVRFDGWIAPGRHLVTVRLELTGKDDDRFTTATESTFVVQAVAGKDLEVAVRAADDGDIAYGWKRGERGGYRLNLDVDVKTTARPGAGTLETDGQLASQLTRRLRDALHAVLAQLQYGQVLLASIGSTAPFIGLFGTVWGIYHALIRIGASGQASIDVVAGPVGEALIMTAFGLFVAIPAVLAYNFFVRGNRKVISRFDEFAHDLHDFFATGSRVEMGAKQARK